MKKTIAILLISLMLFTSGCAVMTAAAPEPDARAADGGGAACRRAEILQRGQL